MNKTQQILVFKMLFRYLDMILSIMFNQNNGNDWVIYERLKEDRRNVFLEIEGR